MLKVGIVGLGTISEIHLAAIDQIEKATLVAVCDFDLAKRDLVPNVPFFTDFNKMLTQVPLDVVHLCLPHHLHVPFGKICLAHEVPFFMEKPLGITYQEAQGLVSLVEEKKLKAGLCFQNRYNASFLRLLKELALLDKTEILGIKGLVTWCRPAAYYTEKPWRGTKAGAGYGTVINQAIHTLDWMQVIGGKISSGHGALSQFADLPIEVEDTATGMFTFEQNIQGYFHATNNYIINDSVEFQVITKQKIYTIKDNQLFVDDGQGKILLVEDEKLPGSKQYYGVSHVQSIAAFYQAIENDTDDYIHLSEGLPTLEMIERMAGIWEEQTQ